MFDVLSAVYRYWFGRKRNSAARAVTAVGVGG